MRYAICLPRVVLVSVESRAYGLIDMYVYIAASVYTTMQILSVQ